MGELGEGTVVQGRYRIEGVLGRGGGGTTYRAARVEDGGGVAVKRLALGDLRDWKLLELAEREARVLSRLEHPAIPRYVEHFVDDGGDGHTFTLVQQLVAARSLRAWREGGWHPRESELQDVAAQVLDVLAYIHALSPPLVHRDIKPENVLRGDDGRIYVVDFGGVRDTVRTATGGSTVVGTFGYMAPEQFRGAATPASDLYGLGATIVYLATGLAPTGGRITNVTSPMHTNAAEMARAGSTRVRTDADGHQIEIELRDCPFFGLARTHEHVVCGIHRGLLRGTLEVLGEERVDVRLEPFVTPSTCRALLQPRAPFPARARSTSVVEES